MSSAPDYSPSAAADREARIEKLLARNRELDELARRAAANIETLQAALAKQKDRADCLESENKRLRMKLNEALTVGEVRARRLGER